MQQTQWSPSTAGVAGCGIAGVVMAIAAVTLITDPPGRVLAGIAGVGLLTFATLSWRARPKLAINQDGLTVAGFWRTRTYRRNEIRGVRITEFRRIARKVRLLEIDTVDDRLVVLTRWDLGSDPLDVLDALTEAGFTAR
ncbi:MULTISPECIES: PH domain-containing protein [unclassified Mycolicibacterium]|uniref:PH domain-containing protein n=1 Tax=unclassified Mycolicibacterium TaxID=2636767 RepID=UPI0012DDE11F|nr:MULTISPECIES: PH domain-containing protein [unclassified Mycolicibacterium]MUL82904.1 PH domain-containing protein [Mycolicibacterium sp. CBMA 329]MUL89239.1 PH domain-containing protein [Mycolicibacterium sp. CBMA 331]MUL97806.1 PH domain-containing protein [Mycolicibacterium sp. CBMA 334]MUM25283.1 PH domain-containing protein [Mycolicibacterium sp. CBMA 295]MUM38755.1 PH domain-containing protein [Mycolicibacterium sp. CBMA 247]